WFLELAKPALNGADAAAAASTRHTLLYVLEALLRALHPLIPFVTEEIWQNVAPRLGVNGSTISTQAYPERDSSLMFPAAAQEIEWLVVVVEKIRSVRSQLGLAPTRTVPLLFSGEEASPSQVARHAASLSFLCRLE